MSGHIRILVRWQTNSEDANLIFVARHPESEAILNREQLAEFTRRLSMLSTPGVEGVYQTAY